MKSNLEVVVFCVWNIQTFNSIIHNKWIESAIYSILMIQWNIDNQISFDECFISLVMSPRTRDPMIDEKDMFASWKNSSFLRRENLESAVKW